MNDMKRTLFARIRWDFSRYQGCDFFSYDSTKMSKVDIWTLRSVLLVEQFPGPFSQCDNISRFLRLELQRAGDSPHCK